MAALLWRRLAGVVPILLVVSVVAFFILQLSPGDPMRLMLGENATDEGIHMVRQELGLDRPLYVQYGLFLWNSLHGNLGRSYREWLSVAPHISLVPGLAIVLAAVSLNLVGEALRDTLDPRLLAVD